MLPVFVEGSRSNHAQLAPCECWLQYVGCVHRTLGSASANQQMQLVDKHNYVCVRRQLFDHFFESLFELATILCTCHHGGNVELIHLFVE